MTIASYSPLQAVILDWAGTTVDFGSRAPTRVFIEIFRRYGIEITVAEARGPMGRAKRDHLVAILQLPRITSVWEKIHGNRPNDAMIDRLYEEFLPLQMQTLSDHVDLIPGTIQTVSACRERGLKIGSTTGYTRELMGFVCPLVAANGYEPDTLVCSGDTKSGRPAPWMIYRAAENLGAYPMRNVAIVDDTPVGIEAGRNAGTWTIAVTKTGNEFGLSKSELAALSQSDIDRLEESARATLGAAGAHFIIDGIGSLPPILREIDRILASGVDPNGAATFQLR